MCFFVGRSYIKALGFKGSCRKRCNSANPKCQRPYATLNPQTLIGSFRKVGVPYFGVLYYKDPTIQGTVLGSPISETPNYTLNLQPFRVLGFEGLRFWGLGFRV